MSEYFNKPHNEENPLFLGSIRRGILGGAVGTLVCTLALLLCWLCQAKQLGLTLQVFVGLAIGWFYRLFHGRRSKMAAYVTVGICTVSACVLWAAFLILLSAAVSQASFTAPDWGGLWKKYWDLPLLCAGMGLTGFFFTRRSLLAYADWERTAWHVAYAGGAGASYNLLPQKLPAQNPPACFAVQSRLAPGTRLLVEGDRLRWKKRIRKDRVFSVHDIAGVALGPSNGCNVLYDQNYQVLATFAGSMEHADLLLAWLLQRSVPMDKSPGERHSPVEAGSDPDKD